MTGSDDVRYMARAIELAELGLFTTDPNPRVGCVIVKNGEIVGEGWHMRAGEPHAEIIALKAAGVSAVIAPTFARIFYRNAFNMGLPIFELAEATEINEGDVVRVDMDAGEVINVTQAKTYKFSPIPEFMQELVDAGGLIAFAKKEIENNKKEAKA